MTTVSSTHTEANLGEFVRGLGTVLGNLLSLELMLREFLFHEAGEVPYVNLDLVNIGDVVPENALTDYSTLGRLIDRYNAIVVLRDVTLTINKDDVLSLRDALAHGRVYGQTPAPPLRLLKFSDPKKGPIKVEFAETLDPTWLNKQRQMLLENLRTVISAFAPPGAV